MSGVKSKMGFEDFVFFILSEEDKANEVALRYWFDLLDLDCDGALRAFEVRTFYGEQMRRMGSLGHEVVKVEDIMTQLNDMLHPDVEGRYVLKEMIKPDKIKYAAVFVNTLFNLNKFVAFEQRDPFMLKQMQDEPNVTAWDRFARAEYARLAMEEDARQDEEDDDDMGFLDDDSPMPFAVDTDSKYEREQGEGGREGGRGGRR